MKKLFFTLLMSLALISGYSQLPHSMKYQLVVRNLNNQIVANQAVGIRVSILQGSSIGNAVYVESHNESSNYNGLVSIEIGEGIVQGGNINLIDWSSGPYFLKTEVDPSGGANYSVISTSQLLSVPYSNHTKVAETLLSPLVETDSYFNTSVAKYITSSDTSGWNNKLSLEVDGSVTNELQIISISHDTIFLSDGGFVKLNPEFDPDFNNSLTSNLTTSDTASWNQKQDKIIAASGFCFDGDTLELTSNCHFVGEFFGGGVVFYVDETGQHGLVISMIDQCNTCAWSNVTASVIGTTSSWDGVNNTLAIINQVNHSYSAAKICNDYVNLNYGTGVYTDWYLPSNAEMSKLWNSLFEVQNALAKDTNASTLPLVLLGGYWTSTEISALQSFYMYLAFGTIFNSYKSDTARIRAIRAF